MFIYRSTYFLLHLQCTMTVFLTVASWFFSCPGSCRAGETVLANDIPQLYFCSLKTWPRTRFWTASFVHLSSQFRHLSGLWPEATPPTAISPLYCASFLRTWNGVHKFIDSGTRAAQARFHLAKCHQFGAPCLRILAFCDISVWVHCHRLILPCQTSLSLASSYIALRGLDLRPWSALLLWVMD